MPPRIEERQNVCSTCNYQNKSCKCLSTKLIIMQPVEIEAQVQVDNIAPNETSRLLDEYQRLQSENQRLRLISEGQDAEIQRLKSILEARLKRMQVIVFFKKVTTLCALLFYISHVFLSLRSILQIAYLFHFDRESFFAFHELDKAFLSSLNILITGSFFMIMVRQTYKAVEQFKILRRLHSGQ